MFTFFLLAHLWVTPWSAVADSVSLEEPGVLRTLIPRLPAIKVEGAIGAGLLHEPFSEGSAGARPIAWPILEFNVYDRLYLDASEPAVQLVIWREGAFSTGPRAGYSWGRYGEYYSAADRGEMSEVPSAVLAGWTAEWQTGPVVLSVAWDYGFAQGSRVTGAVDGEWAVSESLTLSAGASLTWGSARYNNSYFAVSEEDADITGVETYKAQAGLESAGVKLSARVLAPRQWTSGVLPGRLMAQLTAGTSELLGSARLSPLNETTSMRSLFLGTGFEFH